MPARQTLPSVVRVRFCRNLIFYGKYDITKYSSNTAVLLCPFWSTALYWEVLFMASKKPLNVTDGSRSVPMTIILLAWPVFIEQVFSTLVSFADTAMVGALGKEATAAISISNAPIFLLNGIMMALGVGLTTMVAHAVGSGDHDRVKVLMRHALLMILYIGIPISVIVAMLSRAIPLFMGAGPDIIDAATNYNLIVSMGRVFMLVSMVLNSAFRGYGDTKTPMILNIIMNVVNVCGNYLLINPTRQISVFGFEFTMIGAGWGVKGAAAATALGMMLSGVLALIMAFRKSNIYRISLSGAKDLLPDKKLVSQILKISLPAMLERIFMSSSGIVVSSSLATLGTASIAANSLVSSAESLSFMPAFAFQTAITTLTGQSLGAKKPELAQKFLKWTLIMGTVVMAAATVGLYVFAAPLIGVFTPDQGVILLAAECLRLMAIIQIPQMIAWTLAGMLRGAGDTKSGFYITAATNWCIRALFAVLLIRVFHQDLIAYCYVIDFEIMVRLLLMYLRYRSGKWKTIMVKTK